MSYLTIRRLLETQLNTVVPALATAWENAPFVPQQGTPWQRVTILPGLTQNPTWGDNFKRETGILQVTLNYREKEGSQNAITRAELVRAAFPRGLSLNATLIRVLIDEHPSINRASVEDGWYSVPVSIPYIADVF